MFPFAKQNTALQAEVDRLTLALKTANDQAERFEREWYLRGDALEKLRDHCDDSDGFNYGTLNTTLVRGIVADTLAPTAPEGPAS